MSRLGRKPIAIPEKVKVEFKNGVLEVSGVKDKLYQKIDDRLTVKLDNASITLEKKEETREADMLQGLLRGLIGNMFEGVVNGYKKVLELNGLGFKAVLTGDQLTLTVGFSHTVTREVPKNVKVVVGVTSDKIPTLTITGADKQAVGAFAAQVRDVKPPEPYKGFGIRYSGEKIIRKAGKSAAAGAKK